MGHGKVSNTLDNIFDCQNTQERRLNKMREQPHNKLDLPCKQNLTGDNPKTIEAQHRKSDVRRASSFQAEPWYNRTNLLT